MIAAVLSLLLLLLSLSLSVCENNNRVKSVFRVLLCCLTSLSVWESSKVRFSSSLFWVSLKIKGKKTPVLFFSFFFLRESFFSSSRLSGHKKKKKRELSEITPLEIYYFKALSIRAALP